MAETKKITIHPITSEGTLDSNTDIYPKTSADQVVLNNSTLDALWSSKQNTLTASAGSGISITNNTISIILSDFFNSLYPIGSIFVARVLNGVTPTHPSVGTWQRITDTFLYAAKEGTHTTAGDKYPGDTSGSNNAIVPSHTHSFDKTKLTISDHSVSGSIVFMGLEDNMNPIIATSGDFTSTLDLEPHGSDYIETDVNEAYKRATISLNKNLSHTINTSTGIISNTGVATTDKNMPKYEAVYMWVRVA